MRDFNNKKRNFWKWLPFICIICVALISVESKADFGNFSGDSDYGGGGGFDSDFGNDDSGLLTWIIYLIFSALPWPIKLIVIAVLVVAYLFSRFTKAGTSNRRQASQPQGAVPTSSTITLASIAQFKELDPDFEEAEFIQKLSNLYVQMQNCWTSKDISSLRPYFTDSQFAQYDRMLQESIRNRETNHVDRIAVLSVNLNGFYQSGGNDHIIATLSTRITTYTTSDDTGAIIRGSKTAEKFMVYEWDMIRPSGTKTRKEGAITTIACPNCGAPLDINKSAKCPYCDSIVTLDDHDFVIYAIKGISQRTSGR